MDNIIQSAVYRAMPPNPPSAKSNEIWQRARFALRMLFVYAMYFLLLPGVRLWKRGRSNKRIAGIVLANDPVFILGHWRSGTTFLHYLMASDSQFGVMTNFRTFYPWFMDAGEKSFVRTVLGRTIPAKRWDNMALSPDSPQEEEFALHRLFGGSAYAGWYFPKRLKYFFEKYALLRFDDEPARTRFGQQYLCLAKKLTAVCGGLRLLLKNPPNTGRISLLLELFPNARFIYLHREPAEVFYSTIRMHEQLFARFAATPSNGADLPAFVPAFYAQLIERYEAEKTLVPVGNLIEISYEQLVRDPEQAVRDIYDVLNLPGFLDALPAFRAFLETQKNFRPAVYRLSLSERAATGRMMKTGKTPNINL